MKVKALGGVFLVCFLMTGVALANNGKKQKPSSQGVKLWTQYPLIVPEKGRSRKQVNLKTINYSVPMFDVYPSVEVASKGAFWQVSIKNNVGVIETQGQGGYYWVNGTAQDNGHSLSASTVHYFSNPGPAPRTMLSISKSELEISPQKLPREHSSFRANETWGFRTLYKGEALANVRIIFESSNGTKIDYHTDSKGIVQVKFPDDFKEQSESRVSHGGHRRVKADFVLAVQHKDNLSAFNYSYTPDAYAEKSRILGVSFLFLGMLAASPLIFGKKGVRS